MDSYRSVYDQPLVRGLTSSVLLVLSLWALFLVRGNDSVLYVQVLQPLALIDWLWVIGAVSAAHLAGYVSGFLRTSLVWLFLSVALTPFYWIGLMGACGLVGGDVCRSALAPALAFLVLAAAYVVPIVLLSGIQLTTAPRKRNPVRNAWPRRPERRP